MKSNSNNAKKEYNEKDFNTEGERKEIILGDFIEVNKENRTVITTIEKFELLFKRAAGITRVNEQGKGINEIVAQRLRQLSREMESDKAHFQEYKNVMREDINLLFDYANFTEQL